MDLLSQLSSQVQSSKMTWQRRRAPHKTSTLNMAPSISWEGRRPRLPKPRLKFRQDLGFAAGGGAHGLASLRLEDGGRVVQPASRLKPQGKQKLHQLIIKGISSLRYKPIST